MNLSPAFIPLALSIAELRLNVDEQIIFLRCENISPLFRFMLFLAGEDRAKLCFCVAFSERIQTDSLLELAMPKRQIFSLLDRISGFCEQLEERLRICRLLSEYIVNNSANDFPM